MKLANPACSGPNQTLNDQTKRLKLLLTGYGPFPGIPVNASALLVEAIAQHAWPHVDVTAAILPTQWQAGPEQLTRLVRRVQPDIALHFGVAASATGFRIETVGENLTRPDADARGAMPQQSRLSPRGPQILRSTLPCDAILARLQQMRLPAELSIDAGRYLCNAALYRSLQLARTAKSPRLAGFVHIPAQMPQTTKRATASSLHSLDWKRAVEGAHGIIEVCLTHARRQADATLSS